MLKTESNGFDLGKPSTKGFGFENPTKGASDDWLTPPFILEALGDFDLDPCATLVPPWPTAKEMWNIEVDGFSKVWSPEKRIFLNPPYGPQTGKWLERLASHGNGIALVFARTETKAFQVAWQHAHSFLFLSPRVAFYRPDGKKSAQASAPSVLIAFGHRNGLCLRQCGLRGAYVENTIWKEGK